MSTLRTPPGSPYPKKPCSKGKRKQINEMLEPLHRPSDFPEGNCRPFRTLSSGVFSPLILPSKGAPSAKFLPQECLGVQGDEKPLFLPDSDDPRSRGYEIPLSVSGKQDGRGIPITATITEELKKKVLKTPFKQIQLCFKVRLICIYYAFLAGAYLYWCFFSGQATTKNPCFLLSYHRRGKSLW